VTRSITATELKASIFAVLEAVARGEVVEISKRGRPVARLVPVSDPDSIRGRFAGIAATAVDEDELFTAGAAWNAE